MVVVAGIVAGVAAAVPATSPAGHAGKQCKAAEQLIRTDLPAAKRAFAEAAHRDPYAPCLRRVRKKILAASKPAEPGTMKRIETWIGNWSKLIGVVAGAAIVVFAVVSIFLAVLTYARVVRRTLRHVPLLGRIFQPQVAVADFDAGAVANDSGVTKFGTSTSALVGFGLRALTFDGPPETARDDVSTGA